MGLCVCISVVVLSEIILNRVQWWNNDCRFFECIEIIIIGGNKKM